MKKLFSLFALVGAFVACQPEELETAFSVDPAQVTINVNAVDVQTGSAAEGVSMTASVGTVNGNVVTITGTPAIEATTVTLTVTSSKYPDEPATAEVEVNSLLAGGVANYNVVVVVGSPAVDPGYTVRVDKVSSDDPVEEIAYLYNENYHDQISHDYTTEDGLVRNQWYRNDTRFMINVSGTYKVYLGAEVDKNAVEILDDEFESVVTSYVNAYNTGVKDTDDNFSFKISAYCLYTVWQAKYTTVDHYSVYVNDAEVGTFDVSSVLSTSVEYREIADPDGHGHYHQGHGEYDPHGTNDNAGGGIIFAE